MFSPLRGLVTFWRVFPALTRWANEFRRSAAGRGTVFSRVHSAVEKPPLLDKRLFRELFDGGSRRCTPCQLGWALLRCMAWWIRAEAEARLPRVDERWCLLNSIWCRTRSIRSVGCADVCSRHAASGAAAESPRNHSVVGLGACKPVGVGWVGLGFR